MGATPIQRREFFVRCACAAAAPLLDACASVVVRTVTPVDGRVQLALSQYPELAEPGGSLRVLPEGTEQPIFVLADGGGRFTVLSSLCTHLGCTVELQTDRFVCPCHGSTYDRTGTVVRGPAERALRRYGSRLTPDGVLVIDL
jgi:cytochrome b6-f complex iron-sulfur subunit